MYEAGQPAPLERLANIPRLMSAYYTTQPDPTRPQPKGLFWHFQAPRLVAFGQL